MSPCRCILNRNEFEASVVGHGPGASPLVIRRRLQGPGFGVEAACAGDGAGVFVAAPEGP
jgi:hypothetical protein